MSEITTNLTKIAALHKQWLSGEGGIRADLRSANLSNANLRSADLRSADLSNADLSNADLSFANLSGVNLSSVNLSGADLSGATGLPVASEFIEAHFEATQEGVIAYKQFGLQYSPPARWKIETGAILTEVINPDRGTECGSGVNVATLKWLHQNGGGGGKAWKVLIRWPWMADVVVPFHSDGKIRCGRCELVEEVDL
jgi:hypothetical protein